MDFLNSLGTSLVATIFVLGALIFIHELGHYLVAKFLGIRVEVFSLGFGTRLLGFRRGTTDYRLSLIPLGGYVKLSGENPDEELSGSPEEFLSRPRLHRFAVFVAGPLMNLALAVVLVAATFMVGTQILSYLNEPATVGAVQFDSPAYEAGIQQGDRILGIDGETTETWSDVEFKIRTSPELLLLLEMERDGQLLRKEIMTRAGEASGAGYIGVGPFVPYRISRVEPGSAAEEADLRSGDLIQAVRTSKGRFTGFFMIAEAVSKGEIEPLVFEVSRGEELFEMTIVPKLFEGSPRVGAYVDFQTEMRRYGAVDSLRRAVEENIRWTRLTFVTVGRILTGRASMKHISGPIEIARYSGQAASLGWLALISFMALVSLQLGILNLLPIPILDGGGIALLAIEGLLGRDLSVQMRERILKLGFLFLVVLMGVVIVNDITKNLPSF